MRATLTKEFKFEAAHRLPNHDGKCSRPHGHSYRVVVSIEGEIRPPDGHSEEGMVLDFSRVKDAWRDIEPLLDHRDLNESIGDQVGPTTAEKIALWLLGKFTTLLGLYDAEVVAVTVWETASSSVTVRA